VIKSLALFVNALYQNDRQFVALNDNSRSSRTRSPTPTRGLQSAAGPQPVAHHHQGLSQPERFGADKDVNNLADVTNAILQPERAMGWRPACTSTQTWLPTSSTSRSPNAGGIVGLPVINMYANPMQFLCSAIQAGSRLGYQDSAELCAQYLAPILDATKFNYPPFGLNNSTGP